MMDVLIAGAILAGLAIVYKTDSSEKLVEPLADITVRLFEYIVDSLGAKIKLYGGIALEQGWHAINIGIHFAGATIWYGLVFAGRVSERGLQKGASLTKEYGPIVARWVSKQLYLASNELWNLSVQISKRIKARLSRYQSL